jgi:PAS domain S-box-containing protein
MATSQKPTPSPSARVVARRSFERSIPPWNAATIATLYVGWILLSWSRVVFQLWPGISSWYPPAALLAAACILWGGRALLPIIAGSLTMLLVWPQPGEALWRFVVVTTVLKAVYWLAASVLRRLSFDSCFARPIDVAAFTGVMAGAGLLSALLGTSEAAAIGWLSRLELSHAVLLYWAGDLVAVLSLSPALLMMAHMIGERRASESSPTTPAQTPPAPRGRGRDVVQFVAVPVALWLAFGVAPQLGFIAYAICFLPLGWVALTHGVRGAAFMIAALDVGALMLLHWSGVTPRDNLEVQTFMASLALTGLLLGSVADERERARKLLSESEERYRVLIELLPDPLVVHREGRVLFANPAAARVLGASSPGALVGVAFVDMAEPSSKDLIARRVLLLAAGERVELVEHRFRKLDGSGIVDVEAVSIPIVYEGQAAGLTAARDISERRRLEDELRHAQRLEAVGRLAGGVAHDFNNLLTVILSYSQLLLSELEPDAPTRVYADETRHAAERAAALTRQLLTFSRRQVLQPKAVRLNEVVSGTETLIRRLIGPEIRTRVKLGAEAGVVLADPGQLEQVVVNLAVNARDAMPDGGDLTIETSAVTVHAPMPRWPGLEPGSYATLFVSDTGVGIDDSVRMHIFDPFFTTKGPTKGTGLGLATVYGIVKQTGGFIFVESEKGAGALFAIFLPRMVERADTPTHGHMPVALGSAPVPRAAGHGARVLLVEDDDSVRAATRRVLELAGFAVVEATSGRDALARFDADPSLIDVVLSDVAMPEMNGRELQRALLDRGSDVPVILASGYADPDVGEVVPGTVVLQKPLDAATLTAALTSALAGRPSGRIDPSRG